MTTAGDFHRAWLALPVGRLDDVVGAGTCVVLAPHPDDESLGCGGLIASCVAAGRPPLVVVLTDGAGSHPHSPAYPADRLRAVRAEELLAAVGLLGLEPERVVMLGEPDTALADGSDRVVSRLVDLVRGEPTCSAILAPWLHDPHCDHEAAALIAARVAEATRCRHVAYPVWGWTLPDKASVPGSPGDGWRLDVGAFRALKREAVRAHRSQYGGLIIDDPSGFELPEALLSVFDSDFETFVLP